MVGWSPAHTYSLQASPHRDCLGHPSPFLGSLTPAYQRLGAAGLPGIGEGVDLLIGVVEVEGELEDMKSEESWRGGETKTRHQLAQAPSLAATGVHCEGVKTALQGGGDTTTGQH